MIKIPTHELPVTRLINGSVERKEGKDYVEVANWVCDKCHVEIKLSAGIGTKIKGICCPVCKRDWYTEQLEVISA